MEIKKLKLSISLASLYLICFIKLSHSIDCLLFNSGISDSGCFICAYGFYKNPNFQNANDCIKQINNSNSEPRNVFIAPRPISIFISAELKKKFMFYDSLIDTLYKEELLSKEYINPPKVIIHLLKGLHFVLDNDIKQSLELKTSFFKRNEVEIEILPLFCDFADVELKDWCLEKERTVKIALKTLSFSLFIANKITIRNINFDGGDIPFFIVDSPCKNELIICCESLIQECYQQSISYSSMEYYNLLGFLIAEPVIDAPERKIPNISLINISFNKSKSYIFF